MVQADDPFDERPARLTHVIYNAALGHVRIRAEDGPATTVEVPPGEVRFRRVRGAVEPETGLWLDSVERSYLGRMLDHVLGTLKITPEARAALEAVQVKLAELAPPVLIAGEADEPGVAVAESPPPSELLAPPTPAPEPPAAAAVPRSPAASETAPAKLAPEPRRRSRARPTPAADEQAPAGPRESTPPPPAPVGTPPANGARAVPRADGADTSQPPRDLPAETPEQPSPALPEGPHSFEQVWRDLQALPTKTRALHALAGQASSEIREVTPEGVWLYSHGIGREYLVQRERLEAAWLALAQAGHIVPRELRMSYGIVTLLAHLPYVDYSAEPVTLYFPARTPHALGTVVRRDAEP
jgi:hypothetical protein